MPATTERLRQLQQHISTVAGPSPPAHPSSVAGGHATALAVTPEGPKYAFFEGKIVPIEEAKVSVMTTTLHYGTGCFGGLRAYWNEDQQELFAFRLIEHYTRFLNSCKLLMAELPYTAQDLADITVELLKKEGYKGDVYMRPLHYKADLHGGLQLHGMIDELTIYAIPRAGAPPDQGLNLGTSSWRRVDDTMMPARGKLVGAYVNSALIKSEAITGGYDDAVVLTQDGHVSELSGANIFMIRDGVLITPPITDNVLEGITRRTIIELATELGMEVMERSVDRSELYIADEVFECGTGAQVTPIGKVDNRLVGDGMIGPLTKSIQDVFFGVVRGENEDYAHWCVCLQCCS